MDDVERQYSGSGERWGWWYAIAVCKPLPSADESHIVAGSGVQPTVYGACLDNAYLANRELISEFVGDGEVLVGVSAWLCRGYLPEPPATHLRRCDLDRAAGTKKLYPEWGGCTPGMPSCSASLNGVLTKSRGRARTRPAWETCTCRSWTVTAVRTWLSLPRCGVAGNTCQSLLLSTTLVARSITEGGTRNPSCSGRASSTLGTLSFSATPHTEVPRKSRSWFGRVGECYPHPRSLCSQRCGYRTGDGGMGVSRR